MKKRKVLTVSTIVLLVSLVLAAIGAQAAGMFAQDYEIVSNVDSPENALGEPDNIFATILVIDNQPAYLNLDMGGELCGPLYVYAPPDSIGRIFVHPYPMIDQFPDIQGFGEFSTSTYDAANQRWEINLVNIESGDPYISSIQTVAVQTYLTGAIVPIQVDAVEASPCTNVEYATLVWGQQDVTNPENALGQPDELVADLSVSGSYLHLGFSQPICTSLTVHGQGTIFLMAYSPDFSTTPLYIEEAVLNGSASFGFNGESDYVVIRNDLGGTVTIDALEGIACTGVENNPPIADPGGPTYYGEVNTPISFDGSASYDPDGDELTYAWDFGDSGTGSGVNPTHSYAAAGTYNVCLTVNDGLVDSETICRSANISAEPSNTAPVAVPGGPYSGEVDTPVSFDGSGSSDPDGDALTYAWTFGDGGTGIGVNPTHSYAAAGTYNVCLMVNDGKVNSAPVCTTAEVTVPNTAPVADPGGPYLVAVNGSIALDGSGSSDPDGDALTWTWTADGGTLSGSTYTAGSETGIYDVCLTVSDGSLSDAACILAVVYDPSAGFVTGGGWIDSPAGAYTADPSLSGKATFGFVSKYKKGASAPDGNTEFQFQAGGFNFHSTAYDWLVVSKKDLTAQFKGSGTVNGVMDPNGNAYKFMLWAGEGSPDTFRISIWWEGEDGVEHYVYDNGSDQAISGGSVVVHAGK